MKKILRYWPVLFILGACFVYYWKVFLKGFVPIPADLLVGAYEPWLEYKWDFPTGVPVKNPLISDVFSQFYIWKSLVSEGWMNLSLPFWNPYSYSGYPLMANFHSGVFYPLNLIHALLGDIKGWSFLVIVPSIGAALSMYFYLLQIKQNKLGALLGSVVYAYSGFAISWSQFITAAQAMIWMPLVLLVIEKYVSTGRKYYAYWFPILFFLLVTSGHFQIMVYISILTVVYFFWRWIPTKDVKLIGNLILPGILTMGMSLIQIIPTLELTSFGIRFGENSISGHNYGLLPIKNLFTILAPDFFGNPSTGNFFGFFNYHETLFYCGAIAIFAFASSLLFMKKSAYVRFFLVLAVVSLLFGFDTFLGKSVYTFKLPAVSTSDAGRISVLFSLSIGVLSGYLITYFKSLNYKKVLFLLGTTWFLYGLAWLVVFKFPTLLQTTISSLTIDQRLEITKRNLILPSLLVGLYSMIFLTAKRWRFLLYLVVFVAAFDMIRFGWKYMPFVPERIVYPSTAVTDWIDEKSKEEVFRIDRERAEIMPPATWMAYRYMSASGYDPMARADYVDIYQRKINGNESGHLSRYSELERYDAGALGEFNVKYLLVIKRDEVSRIPGENIIHRVDQKEWIKVFETRDTAILENTKYQPRVRFIDSTDAKATITRYESNEVRVSFESGSNKTLLLADSWYPGWKASVNGKETQINKCEGIFRCVKLEDDKGEVLFSYMPTNFTLAASVSGASLLVTILMLLALKKKK